METVDTIQQKINAITDQTTTVPSTDEYALRLSFINRAIEEFNNSYDWESLKRIAYLNITGGATVSLPMDFRKMAAFPLVWQSNPSPGETWPQINTDTIAQYDSSDKYFYILGDRGNGYSMIINPATLASGATVQIQYFSFSTSLASPANVIPLESTEYVVNKTISYIFQTRNDGRYKLYSNDARENLLGMIDQQNDKSKAFGTNNYVGVTINKNLGFKIGRD